MEIKNVNELRLLLKEKPTYIPKEPGVYTWWFDKEGRDIILKELPNIQIDKLRSRVINNVNYWALYFGISSDLKMRLNWHINQKHTQSNVSKGYLSTFRQTLSALLKINMLQSYDSINDFINKHCYWEWQITKTKQDAEKIESQQLIEHYYPLNLSKNKNVDKSILNKLKELRKEFKK